MKLKLQFGFRTLLTLMLLVICFFAGRLSLQPELESLREEVQKRQTPDLIAQRFLTNKPLTILRRQELGNPNRNIERGMMLDRLERMQKLESQFQDILDGNKNG